MGYDIYAYRPRGAPSDPREVAPSEALYPGEIAYLEMTSGARDARLLFEVLGAKEYDGGVSGNGIGRHFAAADVREALRRLCAAYAEGRASERTVRFLAEVADRTMPDEWVYIDFG